MMRLSWLLLLSKIKDRIDDEYSELIKDADLIVQYLNEPNVSFSKEKQRRLNNIFKTFNK